MSAPSTSFCGLVRSVAGAVSATALLAASPAQALDLTQQGKAGTLGAYMSEAVRSVKPKDIDPGTRVGGFVGDLRASLATPQPTAKSYIYPRERTPDMLAIAYSVPANNQGDVYACAEEYGKVLGTWVIKDSDKIVPVQWNGPAVSEVADGKIKPACNQFIIVARKMQNEASAQAPAQGGNK